jgi:uncharacterized membrane protein
MTLPNVSDPQVKKDIEENKILAAIGYVSILCILPLILKPKSEFCKFHGKQGLILVIASFINMVIGIIPIIGWIVSFVGGIAIIVLSLLGIYKAYMGEYWEMPYVSEYAKKINI